MKPFSILLVSSLATVQAWAPIQTAPTKLPKVLEFAEKAWIFPKRESISSGELGPRKLPEETLHRMLPWTHQQGYSIVTPSISSTNTLHKASVVKEDNNDRFYFDGYSGSVTEWPTRQAFLESVLPTKKKSSVSELEMVSQDNDNAVLEYDYYYDDMGGAPLSWVYDDAPTKNQEEKTCKYHYFDGTTGKSICWSSPSSSSSFSTSTPVMTDSLVINNKKKQQQPTVKTIHSLIEECDNQSYYDGTADDILCWIGE